jgi:hypothetical protein
VAAEEIAIDVHGDVVRVPRDVVSRLAAAAAADAGVSSRHRNLSLVLGRSLESGRVVLGRSDVRALRAVLEQDPGGYGPGGEELLRVASAASA